MTAILTSADWPQNGSRRMMSWNGVVVKLPICLSLCPSVWLGVKLNYVSGHRADRAKATWNCTHTHTNTETHTHTRARGKKSKTHLSGVCWLSPFINDMHLYFFSQNYLHIFWPTGVELKLKKYLKDFKSEELTIYNYYTFHTSLSIHPEAWSPGGHSPGPS